MRNITSTETNRSKPDFGLACGITQNQRVKAVLRAGKTLRRAGTWLIVALALAGPTTAAAQSGPTPGCYLRIYSADHLKAHPEQVVSALRMRVYDHDGHRYAGLEVLFANQGHVRRAGQGEQLLNQSLACWQGDDNVRGCAVDCDGGSFRVVRETNQSMTIETDYLWVGETEECGGAIDLSEGPGKPTRYRLDRAADAQCGGL